MEEDSEPVPRRPSAFAFMRRPMFVFSLLFLAWIFLGQPMLHRNDIHIPTSLMHETPIAAPAQPPATPQTPVPAPAPVVTAEKDAATPEMQHRIDALEAKIKSLEDAAAAAPKPVDDSALNAKIAALQASVTTLEQAHSTASGDAANTLDALHKQADDIAALKTQLADMQTNTMNRLSLVGAFTAFKDAVSRGDSFGDALKQMNDLAKDNTQVQPLLTQLAPYADAKAPTLAELQSMFSATIPKALASNDNITRYVQSLIRIRKVGEQQTGTNDEAIIARAEAKLKHGDVKTAAGEIAALSPNAAAAFAAWNERAQAFLHIHDTIDTLQPLLLKVGG